MSRETQWKALRSLGIPELGCAVVMGHALAESGCECNRLQGDFEITRAASRAYTQLVDTRSITRDDFIYRGPGGGGYGWLQWTYPTRKAGYYDNARQLGVSIGSEEAAISWFWTEAHKPEYAAVLDAILHGTDLRAASDVFMRKFEAPADQSEAACANRARLCQQMLDTYGGQEPQPEPAEPEPDPDWDFTVAIQQCCMVRDGYMKPQDVTGKKDKKYREMFPEYAADCVAC